MSAARFDLAGKVALVTGASSGLGEHFARTLAASGATVIAAARREDRLAALAKAAALAGAPDIVVNNAGIAQATAAIDMDDAEWRRVLDTNLDGAWRVARSAARAMIAAGKGGSIVNIASVLGLRVASHLLAYIAAKSALIQVTKALSLEWARHGIRVNAIAPGYIETDMNRDFFATDAGRAMVKRIPQRRVGTPADLDGALLLLASDASAYITGSVLVVDGGHLNSSL